MKRVPYNKKQFVSVYILNIFSRKLEIWELLLKA